MPVVFDDPFYRTRTDEEREKAKETEKRETFGVSVNAQERIMLDALKEVLNVKSDGKALKIGAQIGLSVIQATFPEPIRKYLFSVNRQKLTDFKTLE